jgi:hypothetical protein
MDGHIGANGAVFTLELTGQWRQSASSKTFFFTERAGAQKLSTIARKHFQYAHRSLHLLGFSSRLHESTGASIQRDSWCRQKHLCNIPNAATMRPSHKKQAAAIPTKLRLSWWGFSMEGWRRHSRTPAFSRISRIHGPRADASQGEEVKEAVREPPRDPKVIATYQKPLRGARVDFEFRYPWIQRLASGHCHRVMVRG